MSFDLFWFRVQAALETLEQSSVNDRLERSALAAIADDYDEKDFEFLVESDRDELTSAVQRLRKNAEDVSGDESSSGESGPVLDAFKQLCELLQFDKYHDAEAFQIGKALETGWRDRLPPWVMGWEIETELDSSGEDAVWIWVIVSDEIAKEEADEGFESVRKILRSAIEGIGNGRWPFIRFRTQSEVAALAKGGGGDGVA